MAVVKRVKTGTFKYAAFVRMEEQKSWMHLYRYARRCWFVDAPPRKKINLLLLRSHSRVNRALFQKSRESPCGESRVYAQWLAPQPQLRARQTNRYLRLLMSFSLYCKRAGSRVLRIAGQGNRDFRCAEKNSLNELTLYLLLHKKLN